MNSKYLNIIFNSIKAIGLWSFVANYDEVGEENILLCLFGVVVVYLCIALKKLVFIEEFKEKKIRILLSIALTSIGIITFVYNVQDDYDDAKIFYGFGIGLTYLGISLLDGVVKGHNYDTYKRLVIYYLTFLIIVVFYINIYESLDSIDYKVREIERTVDNINDVTKYLDY